MAKKAKKATKAAPLVVTQMRVAKVDTPHGEFLRLMWLQTTDGEISETQFVSNYFDDAQAIQVVINGMVEALQLPVVCVNTIARRH